MNIAVGDKVRFPTNIPPKQTFYNHLDKKEMVFEWDSLYDVLLGKEATITTVILNELICLSIDDHLEFMKRQIYPKQWFEKIWPPDPPKTLYKYRSFDEWGLKILTENELYFSPPILFNDPFDCKLTIDLNLLEQKEILDQINIEIVNQYLGYCFFCIQNDLTKKIVPTHEFTNILKTLNDLSNSKDIAFAKNFFLENKKTLQAINEVYHFNHIDKHIGILSLSETCENILMWSHYSYNHTGFCIGLNYEKVKESTNDSNGGFVQYVDEYPQIDPNNQIELLTSFIQTHYKAQNWNYEREFRISKFFKDGENDLGRVLKIEKECIDEIIVGLCTSDKDRIILLNFAKEKNVPIFQMIKSPNSYGLMKIEINY